ncbi:hypothetical protein CU098_013552 [Rhizopus stolonifer]|uniref:Major facilitator superfamily (MFS) profile domain-containing protein n=1 Tax=Rhizopus stolonifer TaxID=4846 RepID=A0A367KXL8_RHIST|nr:hypothetical protein CU098_013552 [Rhizopus stolonifer]
MSQLQKSWIGTSSLTVTSTLYHKDSSVTLATTEEKIDEKTDRPYSIFTKNEKLAITITVSLSAFFCSFSTNIYFPALRVIQKTTEQLISLTVTMYLIFQGIAPSFWGAIADTWGRRPVYVATLFVYSLASVGAGFSRDYPMLLVMRMLQAVGSSSSIAVGAGTIGDISTPAERGGYMGIYSMLTQIGPVAGPILGGLISQTLGWRWIFWILAVMSSLLWIILVLFLPETLRSLVNDGSGYANPTPLQFWKRRYGTSSIICDPPTKHKREPIRVFQSLSYLKEKDVALLLVYYALQYGALHGMLSSLTKLFTENYKLNTLQIGLCYLASGVGASAGSYSSGKLLNWQFSKSCHAFFGTQGQLERQNLDPEFPIEATRLSFTGLWGIAFSLFTCAYGWCLQLEVHIAVPLIISFFMAFSSGYIFCTINTLLVDLFPDNSAAIIASNNLTRSLVGALAVFCVNPGVNSIGTGWFFTIIGIVILISRVMLIIELKMGPQWRRERLETKCESPV